MVEARTRSVRLKDKEWEALEDLAERQGINGGATAAIRFLARAATDPKVREMVQSEYNRAQRNIALGLFSLTGGLSLFLAGWGVPYGF